MTAPAMPDESFDWRAVRDRLREAADTANEAPPAWRPEPGDELVGVVVDVAEAVPTRHGPVPVVTLQGPNGGRRSVWLIHTALRREFIRRSVQLGEVVLVRYVGVVTPDGGGMPWHDYRVVVDRAGSSSGPDWRAIAEQHDDVDALELEAATGPVEPPAPAPVSPAPAPSSSSTSTSSAGEQQQLDEQQPATPARTPATDPCPVGQHDYVDGTCTRCGDADIPF